MRSPDLRLLVVFVFGLFGDPAVAQEGTDMRLVDAGFIMRPADTPEKLARLKRVPPRKFVRRKTEAGHYYIYADPDYCKCVLLGDQRAMRTYRDMVKAPLILPTESVSPSGESLSGEVIQDLNTDIGDTPASDILNFRF